MSIIAPPEFSDRAAVRELIANRRPFIPVHTDHPLVAAVARSMGCPVSHTLPDDATPADIIELGGAPMARKAPVPAREAVRKATPSEQRALAKKAKEKDKTSNDGRPAPQPAVMLDQVPDIADCLPDLVEEYRALSVDRAVIQLRLDELGPEIVALLEAVGQRSVMTDNWQVTRAQNVNVSISAEKLVELGVDPETITAATIRKPTRAFAKVTIRGEETGDGQ